MAINEEHEQKMRELQRSYVDFLDDSDRSLQVMSGIGLGLILLGILLCLSSLEPTPFSRPS